jgi:hypothetical protein
MWVVFLSVLLLSQGYWWGASLFVVAALPFWVARDILQPSALELACSTPREPPRRKNVMSTITVDRADLTSEEASEALRNGLGPRYNVLPWTRMARSSRGKPHPDQVDAILVGTGSNRVWRAELEIIRNGQQISFNVSSGGISWIQLVNNRGIARKIHKVLSRVLPALGRSLGVHRFPIPSFSTRLPCYDSGPAEA